MTIISSPVEGLRPLDVEHGREGGDDLEVCNDDLESYHQGVLPLLHELKQPGIKNKTVSP